MIPQDKALLKFFTF